MRANLHTDPSLGESQAVSSTATREPSRGGEGGGHTDKKQKINISRRIRETRDNLIKMKKKIGQADLAPWGKKKEGSH